MRVLMLSWEYPPHVVGGLGRHVMCLAPALTSSGTSVTVLTPRIHGGAPAEQTPDGVAVARFEAPLIESDGFLAMAHATNTLMLDAAADLVRADGPFDLVHAHDWLVAEGALALAERWGRPLVATIHATERGRMQGYLGNAASAQIDAIERRLSTAADRVIACSRFMADQVAQDFGTPAGRIDVVPNGVAVPPSLFASAADRLAFRRTLAADDEPLVFYVGRLVFEKGLHVLLNAWPAVLAQQPAARLVIAGTGGQRDALRQQAEALGLTERVDFAGFIADEDRDRIYQAADAAVFPSIYEPFGIVALEAMAAGCPVVVSATGGLAEVVRLHETGITVYPNNPSSLAWGVLHTIQHPEWSRERAAAARREVDAQYLWSTVAEQTAAVYRRAAGAAA